MTDHRVVSRDEWIGARRRLLNKEKEFLRLRDQLSAERRELPWVTRREAIRLRRACRRGNPCGAFAGRSQLIVYHFMFAPEWERDAGAAHSGRIISTASIPHLNHRDVPGGRFARAAARRSRPSTRMGWNFKWVSAADTEFNYDYHVSFKPEDMPRATA